MKTINNGVKIGSITCFGAGRLEFKTTCQYTLKPEYAKHFIRTKKINQLVGEKEVFSFTPDEVTPKGAALISGTVIAFPNERHMFTEKLDFMKAANTVFSVEKNCEADMDNVTIKVMKNGY